MGINPVADNYCPDRLALDGQARIETGFRVQDEARVSSKSKDVQIRFFYLVYEQVLQLLWLALYKEDFSFKQF